MWRVSTATQLKLKFDCAKDLRKNYGGIRCGDFSSFKPLEPKGKTWKKSRVLLFFFTLTLPFSSVCVWSAGRSDDFAVEKKWIRVQSPEKKRLVRTAKEEIRSMGPMQLARANNDELHKQSSWLLELGLHILSIMWEWCRLLNCHISLTLFDESVVEHLRRDGGGLAGF